MLHGGDGGGGGGNGVRVGTMVAMTAAPHRKDCDRIGSVRMDRN